MENHKVFRLGNIDFYNKGRKINLVTINIELRKERLYNPKKGAYFSGQYYISVQGQIWNATKTNAIVSGQCDFTLKEYFKDSNPLFNLLHTFWQKYHLKNLSILNDEEYDEVMKIFNEKNII